MKNPADLKEVCEQIVDFARDRPIHDVIEQTPYSETELIYELALSYIKNKASNKLLHTALVQIINDPEMAVKFAAKAIEASNKLDD
jgi:hypothetical protein